MTKELLLKMYPQSTDNVRTRYVTFFDPYFAKYGINTPQRQAMFFAQIGHESAQMTRVEESLNYSAEGLLSVFGKYFTKETAAEFARKPEQIANRVYANRMGNGDEASGDGWNYRGRGLIQITGKNNYADFDKESTTGCVKNPQMIKDIPELTVYSACWWWRAHGCNELADTGSVEAVTKRINGGLNGINDRKQLYASISKIFGI
jgi:putative chitinase